MVRIVLSLLLILAAPWPAPAADLLNRPVLVLDPGMHVAPITALSTDTAGTRAATGSQDGTVRVWNAETGALLRTIRLPQGTGNIGRPYSVAISPDGGSVAVGGWTRYSDDDRQEQIYLYSTDDGALLHRIEGLPSVVLGVAFRHDGARLAAVLGGGAGMRLYAAGPDGWDEVAADATYRGRSHGVAFAPDGSFATASFDGQVRSYSSEGRLLRQRDLGGRSAFSLDYAPGGELLAVGFLGGGGPEILDAATLATRIVAQPPPGGEGDLTVVDWSADGGVLHAAGSWHVGEVARLLGWSPEGQPRMQLPAAQNTVSGIRTLPGGDILVATAEPTLQRLSPVGRHVWTNAAHQIDPVDQHATLATSHDGGLVEFRLDRGGERVRFDLASQAVVHAPSDDGRVTPPDQDTLSVVNWNDSAAPALQGRPLEIAPWEMARSLAIRPGGRSFVIGTDWHLRAYDATGDPLWIRAAPSAAWAVNITGDGRLLVAAYGDGTIRWHRMDDGIEVLALFLVPGTDDWVAWTPEGVYNATPGARAVLRWLVNRGWDAPADAVPVSQVAGTLRPDVIPLVLNHLGTAGALAAADLSSIRANVQKATGSPVAPGAQLHFLTIGVADYNDETAAHLDLRFADNDANDLAQLLFKTQKGLYAAVHPQRLLNEDATLSGISKALEVLEIGMARGNDDDLAVIHFSGHGAAVGEEFFLLPHDVDASSPRAVSDTAIEVTRFQRRIAEIARHGRVVLLIDACRSGASAGTGESLQADGERLKARLYGANISVLTSSSANQDSREDERWQNGAFTEILLEAIGSQRADRDHNGVLTMTEITDYVTQNVEMLTERRQTPSIEVRFQSAVFMTGS